MRLSTGLLMATLAVTATKATQTNNLWSEDDEIPEQANLKWSNSAAKTDDDLIVDMAALFGKKPLIPSELDLMKLIGNGTNQVKLETLFRAIQKAQAESGYLYQYDKDSKTSKQPPYHDGGIGPIDNTNVKVDQQYQYDVEETETDDESLDEIHDEADDNVEGVKPIRHHGSKPSGKYDLSWLFNTASTPPMSGKKVISKTDDDLYADTTNVKDGDMKTTPEQDDDDDFGRIGGTQYGNSNDGNHASYKIDNQGRSDNNHNAKYAKDNESDEKAVAWVFNDIDTSPKKNSVDGAGKGGNSSMSSGETDGLANDDVNVKDDGLANDDVNVKYDGLANDDVNVKYDGSANDDMNVKGEKTSTTNKIDFLYDNDANGVIGDGSDTNEIRMKGGKQLTEGLDSKSNMQLDLDDDLLAPMTAKTPLD